MDTYAAYLNTLTSALELRDAIHIGHSTGGGEVVRYVARYGKGRVAKAVLISSVPPVMIKSEKTPAGLAKEVFDQIVPYEDSAPLSVTLLKDGTLKTYEGYPRGAFAINAEVINPDLLAFMHVLTPRGE